MAGMGFPCIFLKLERGKYGGLASGRVAFA
jgi:hypothetical protein